MKVTRTVVLLAVLLGLAAPVAAGDMPLLVNADWLRANLGAPDLRIVDMQSGVIDYRQGHVPGAVPRPEVRGRGEPATGAQDLVEAAGHAGRGRLVPGR